MMPTRTLTWKAPPSERMADKESSPDPSVTDKMKQYMKTLDEYIKVKVYEGTPRVDWRVISWGISEYYPNKEEDPDYDQKIIVYGEKLRETRKKQHHPSPILKVCLALMTNVLKAGKEMTAAHLTVIPL